MADYVYIYQPQKPGLIKYPIYEITKNGVLRKWGENCGAKFFYIDFNQAKEILKDKTRAGRYAKAEEMFNNMPNVEKRTKNFTEKQQRTLESLF